MGVSKVPTAEALRFCAECLKIVGVNAKAAEQQAELLIMAERIGHPSHGINRLEMYVNYILTGTCMPNNEPCIVKESPSTALVEGDNILGAPVSHFAMDIAICKAKQTGVGWVSVRGSNHNGIAGFWAKKAADQGLIGMAFTNTAPLLAPTRSKIAALGTNPISVVAPGANKELFWVDIATSAAALGKVEMALRRGENIPPGWAQGPDGRETTDAALAYKTSCVMPLGGLEKNSGYKGYCLAAIVELFCGICSGGAYSIHMNHWSYKGQEKPDNLCHCFAAIDPGCFEPGFGERLTDCMQSWRKLDATEPNLPVLAPGDKEWKFLKETDACGAIPMVKQQIEDCCRLANRLNVKPMQVLE